jgi:hypothetical protein
VALYTPALLDDLLTKPQNNNGNGNSAGNDNQAGSGNTVTVSPDTNLPAVNVPDINLPDFNFSPTIK